jgi:hypothetical protein
MCLLLIRSLLVFWHGAEVVGVGGYDKPPFSFKALFSRRPRSRERRDAEAMRAAQQPVPLPQVCPVIDSHEVKPTRFKFTAPRPRQADIGPPEVNQAPVDAGAIPGPPDQANSRYVARVR